jgi:alkanesulfonate monooxygenase SsuD/methylene tetrahydromethanopterin reductase-like flavin-dependent oxidoreductase (luciferase family)
MTIRVGIDLHDEILTADPTKRRALLRHAADAGLDHIGLADHVSFHGGTGFDGLVSTAIAVADQDSAAVVLGVYQLALRHPVTVARQLATLAQIAPGRLVFGVGAGGEDRAEVSNCGVEPSTRGRRLDESLAIVTGLAGGDPVTFHGEFFTVDTARIVPAPQPRIPIVVGGRGDAAALRAGRYGDGWLGIYVSPSRFAAMVHQVRSEAHACGRPDPQWFGLNVWCGFGRTEPAATHPLAERMESLYRLPFSSFARYCPAGTSIQVADALSAYLDAGCRTFTITAAGPEPHATIDAVAQVRRRLRSCAAGASPTVGAWPRECHVARADADGRSRPR